MDKTDNVRTMFGKMTFDSKHCFLCGDELNRRNSTLEHIFPKWLQHKHNLWNQKIALINDSAITYKRLVIPCCKKCNNEYLSEVEQEIQKAFEYGVDAVRNIKKITLYKWFMKILYAILYKELSLRGDIKDENSKMIVSPAFLKRYELMFNYMMSIRNLVDINEGMSSIFIFEIHKSNYVKNQIEYDFYYGDDIFNSQIAFQSDGIGIICCLGDSKVIEDSMASYLEPFYQYKLNRMQYFQLIADIFYKRSLLTTNITHIMAENEITTIPPIVISYNEYNYKAYAQVLYNRLYRFGFSFKQLYIEKYDAVTNFMIDENKRLVIYDEDGTYRLGSIHKNFKGECFKNTNLKIKIQNRMKK